MPLDKILDNRTTNRITMKLPERTKGWRRQEWHAKSPTNFTATNNKHSLRAGHNKLEDASSKINRNQVEKYSVCPAVAATCCGRPTTGSNLQQSTSKPIELGDLVKRRRRKHVFIGAIIILLAYHYEMYTQRSSLFTMTNQQYNYLTTWCLPDFPVFIRLCAAESHALEVQPPPTNHTRNNHTMSLAKTLPLDNEKTINLSKLTTITTRATNSNNNNNSNATTVTNTTANVGARNATTPSNATTTITRHQHYTNVLCNSRCNCVILEPLTSEQQHQLAETQQKSLGPNTTGGSTGSQQKASELDLIAFNEDYSLDYEQPNSVSLGNEDSIGPEEMASSLAPHETTTTSTATTISNLPLVSQSLGQSTRAEQNATSQDSTIAASKNSPLPGGEPSRPGTTNSTSSKPKPSASSLEATKPTNTPVQQPSSAGMSLFPLHLHHHHLQREREPNGPQLYAQSLYSAQAPKLSYHAHTPYLKSSSPGLEGSAAPMAPPGGPMPSHGYFMRPGYPASQSAHQMRLNQARSSQPPPPSGQQRLVPLRSMDMSAKLRLNVSTAFSSSSGHQRQPSDNISDIDWKKFPHLIDSVESMLTDIDRQDIQSLILRDNGLQFELWSELYALLASQFRQHLFHLDLSHNSLVKLGITFTGYIEHHLAAHGTWPGLTNQSSVNNTADRADATRWAPQMGGNKVKVSARMRHSLLLSGGKLYTLVQQRLATSGKIMVNDSANQANFTQQHQHHETNSTMLLLQPMLIKALDLSHNKLKWLINDQFRALKHVQTIRLDHNRIRYIHQHAFSGLESLRFLNLNFNRLQVIYIEQFQTNYNLLALMLRSNYLAYLRGGAFASLSNLKRLDLSRNKLAIMSNNAFIGLESLELLNCSSNQFVHAPSASLHPLTSLRQLDLSDNLISQLAPGTFFHLPIEELWLNQNEQLVSIDRGAFWDLPYLRKLHLRSNLMLMSINSQAFVGTQNLQSIDADESQSLDESARQMLDNITMAATSRLLRLEQSRLSNVNYSSATSEQQPGTTSFSREESLQQQQQQVHERVSSSTLQSNATTINLDKNSQSTKLQVSTSLPVNGRHLSIDRGSANSLGSASRSIRPLQLKYAYYLATVALLVVALKLVFKYTSTSHYMETRRRRRRVYEASSPSASDDNSSSSGGGELDSYQMGCLQPHHVIQQTSARHSNAGSSVHDGYSSIVGANDDVDHDDNSPYQHQEQHSNEQPQQQPCDPCNTDDKQPLEQQQQTVESNDISVICNAVNMGRPSICSCSLGCGQPIAPTAADSSDLPLESSSVDLESSGQMTQSRLVTMSTDSQSVGPNESAGNSVVVEQQEQQSEEGEGAEPVVTGEQQQQPPSSTLELIHSQLIAAGFDYGHANCAHFYHSLGPALQLADMTANFVNNMDYY